MEKLSADESLQIRLSAEKTIWGKATEAQKNAIVSQNILHSDLGYHSDGLPDYALSDGVRDRLTAHSRQDAALAALNAASNMKTLRTIKRLLWIILFVRPYFNQAAALKTWFVHFDPTCSEIM